MLCPIGQSNEKPPLQALAKWREYVTKKGGVFTIYLLMRLSCALLCFFCEKSLSICELSCAFVCFSIYLLYQIPVFYQKQDRWTTAQEFYLSLRFPSIPSSFFSHRLFPGRFISFIFFILPSDVPEIRLPSPPTSSPPLQAPALPPG